MTTYMECGEWDKAIALYNQTERRDRALDSLAIRAHISLIGDHAQNGRMDQIHRILHNEQYSKHLVLWNAALNGLTVFGDAVKCKELFHSMPYEFGLRPNKKTYAVLFNALGHCGDIQFLHFLVQCIDIKISILKSKQSKQMLDDRLIMQLHIFLKRCRQID